MALCSTDYRHRQSRPCARLAVLAEAGTDAEHVAKLTIYLAAGIDAGAAYAATRSVWGDHRTAVTVLAVTPARPGALVEIEAVATLPDPCGTAR
jgi:enamine deaminase RidA (YjgF/YER057c/UK114 family)